MARTDHFYPVGVDSTVGAQPARHGTVDFEALFRATRDLYLILDPRFVIVAANDAYLRATLTDQRTIVGRSVFEVFPENTSNVLAMAATNLRTSLSRVLQTAESDIMAIQRYDIPCPSEVGDGFEKRYWSPINSPVLNSDDEVIYILHRVEDVTDVVRTQEAKAEQTRLLEARAQELESEMSRRANELQRLNIALRDANAQHDLVLDSVGEAVLAVDRNWRITYLNKKAGERVRCDNNGLVGQDLWSLFPEERSQPIAGRLRAAMDSGQAFHFDHFTKRDRRWTENRVYPSGEGLVLFSSDVTERKQTELHLRSVRARLRMAMRVGQLGFWEMDFRTGDVYFSQECLQQLGYQETEFPESLDAWRELVHPDDRAAMENSFDRVRRPGLPELELEYRLKHRSGNYRWIHARFMLVEDGRENSAHVVVTHLDVTERKKSDERIRHSARHDPLTTLPNRAFIYEFAEELLSRKGPENHPFAVMFLDLDNFKPINDLYGHKMGDAVLQIVSGRLAASVRADDLVGRLAGDEFVLILPDIAEPEDAGQVARHVLEALNQPFQINGCELRISPSVGISVFPSDGLSIDALIQSADAAMYQSKQSGRNTYRFFDPLLCRKLNCTHEIEQRLRISLDRQEFQLFYQPVFDTQTRAVLGVEALLRWFPDGAQAEGPGVFIPVAETAGLMKPLGDWVFQQACQQHQQWREQGLGPISIGINVSAVQLQQESFCESLAGIIAGAELEPKHLIIELTETALMKDAVESGRTLRRLKELGLQIALDDFGTGYSSLSQLGKLPIDILKVDQSFTRDLQAENARSIVEAIVSLGRTLGLAVVAEGIESEDAYDLMRTQGCQRVQGFMLAEPMPADEFATWYLALHSSSEVAPVVSG